MMDVLHFVFSSFWVWLGTAVLLAIVASAAFNLFQAVLLAVIGRQP
jgi:hypothetical protein